jgi:tetratricopeptide (TPR) repeat protein
MKKNMILQPRGIRRMPRAAGRLFGAVALLLTAALPACDFLDPTNVENPQTTTDDLANAENPTAALVAGLQAQFARALGATVVATESVSDNYSIHATGYSQEVDDPYGIVPSVTSLNGTGGPYFLLQELRALGDFVLEEIAPEDDTATPDDLAEGHFYRGMAFLMQGENFVAVPTERDGEPVPAQQLLERAVADFERVLALAPDGDFALPARAALARTHRDLGNIAMARSFANEALAEDPDFVFAQGFDVNSVSNLPFIFLVGRPAQEMQPLPRLDFLDPKYLAEDAAIVYAKAEEMHLILAEAALAENSDVQAMLHLADAIDIAESRPVQSYFDTDARFNAGLIIRPRDSEIDVRADPESLLREGLVMGNGTAWAPEEQWRGNVQVPTISGTSLDADSVLTLATREERIHAMLLARQEILFLEARRMHDLGIRLPITQREIDASPTIDQGSTGTSVLVPSWIPQDGEMDLFDPVSPYVNPTEGAALATTEVTIQHDMNLVLAQNWSEVSPFLRE